MCSMNSSALLTNFDSFDEELDSTSIIVDDEFDEQHEEDVGREEEEISLFKVLQLALAKALELSTLCGST